MALKDWFTRQEQTQPIETFDNQSNLGSIHSFMMDYNLSQPTQNFFGNINGYYFGADNLYPQMLNNLFNSSPAHSYALLFKKLMSVGKGYQTTNTMNSPMGDLIALNQLLSQWDCFYKDLALDYFLHSQIYIQVTWNSDNTKIVKLERLAPEKMRIATVDKYKNALSYYFCYDWYQTGLFEKIELPRFDQYNKKDKVQVFCFQVKSPGMLLYALPTYLSAYNWIVLDSEMGVYHKSNILNSINPSVLVEIFKKPANEEEKQAIITALNKSYAGARAAGRAMIVFNNDVATKTNVTQMQANQLDKTFLNLTDTIVRQILTGHQINPVLLGVKTAGSLGDSGEIESAYNLFSEGVIKPAQEDLESIINLFISINGLTNKIHFDKPDIFTVSTVTNQLQSQTKSK